MATPEAGDKDLQVSPSMESISLEDKPAGGGDAIYTSETRGDDEFGEGTYKVPYKTILQVRVA